MTKKRLSTAIILLLLLNLLLAPSALAVEEIPYTSDGAAPSVTAPTTSHRLIVQLQSPLLCVQPGRILRDERAL